ncbi:MAG: TIGR00701 family protein [Halobacteriovoraceae bacterium]|nr:TIGR00701 family protein [Halobacteriovoraceae bacterium]|tara:strand:- start:9147 stop:9578 length:432 start_codon:yes stop_codon:yes gene_type:complete
MSYFIFKALHLIAMVAWFAGLFYMFRLFVYHVENKAKPDATLMLKTMERKLYYYITMPAMIATVAFGLTTLAFTPHNMLMPWMHIKLTLLVLLIGYHFYIGYTFKRFNKDDIFLTSKQCRLLNEVPTLFLISIIGVAVFRSYI